eukprot:9503902-Pyramimonas_sp.AAC.1
MESADKRAVRLAGAKRGSTRGKPSHFKGHRDCSLYVTAHLHRSLFAHVTVFCDLILGNGVPTP